MARRTKAEAQETRAQILDAAEQVFYRKGVLSASLNDIASEAGVTRGAIYWHFKNKHDVFMAMADRRRLPMEALAQRGEDSNEPDPLGRLREFMVYLLQQVARDPHQRRVFEIMFQKCEFTGENEALLVRQREACREAVQGLSTTFRNAVARGQLPLNLDIGKAVTLFHSLLTGLVMYWLFDPQAFDLEACAGEYVDTYLHGLSATPFLRHSP
ncbi:transcriptional regulator TtgR [Alcanivorax hongdengensis A-11-3]|uniref:Transcriptional regulator TtgR n=1 Tax=Alcanivorax hongdengensis A-11-3 TaxID=1177179 RepID=L0WE05_9GAMM|nr:TetR family transcriptional regulator [Alcanivorax hongdengensis]EKF74944.1 transcriptional regulator TtgR [Alcanivorax hongdengensis A-11-3]